MSAGGEPVRAFRPPRWTKDPPPPVAPSPAVSALTTALSNAGARADADARVAVLDRFWARVDAAGTPLVEPAQGDPDARIVTFLWRDRHGTGPGTRGVLLLANKLTDPTVPEHSALERVAGTDVWHRAYRLASSWRGTYALAPDDGDAPVEDAALGPASRWSGVATRAQPDPRNPRTFPGARGGAPLSVLELADAPPQADGVRTPAARRGVVTEHEVPGLGPEDPRRAWVHVPAGSAGRPHRLLVLLDGDEWVGRRDAPAILDALHRDGLVPPLVTLMLDGGSTPDRWRDMTAGAPYLDLLTTVLPAWARAHVPALAAEAAGGILLAGQSLGGLAVLRSAAHAPERVRGALAQSASLWFPDQEGPRSPSSAVAELAAAPSRGVRLHVEVGRDEWVLLPAHRALHDALVRRGDDHVYVEYEGGHDVLCWRAGLAAGLRTLTRPEA